MAAQKRKPVNAAVNYLGYVIMDIVTLPYYRFLNQNTLIPIKSIVKAVRVGKNTAEVFRVLTSWQERKLFELQFVTVAGTLLAGAVIGCFSWTARNEEHWLGPASWYCCLVFSLFAILLSSAEASIISSLKNSPHQNVTLKDRLPMICHTEDYPKDLNAIIPTNDMEKGKATEPPSVRCHIRWNMVFTWQAPIMLLSYAVVTFLVGITVYIITPLYTNDQSLGGKPAAIFYLAALVASGAVFVWSSFWAYRFVNLDGDGGLEY